MATNPMTWPQPIAKIVKVTAAVGFGIALAAFILRLLGGNLTFWVELPGALLLAGVVAVPPTLALLSLRDRPLMLLPAGVLGVAGLLGVLSILGIPLAVLGIFWLWAYLRLNVRGMYGKKFAMVAVPLLWVGALVSLFAHVDPYCEQVFEDGRVESVDPAVRGFESGWVWDVETSSFSGSSTASVDVVSESCASDTVVLWELGVSLLFSGMAVGFAWSVASTDEVSSDTTVDPSLSSEGSAPR